jgi:molybdopterin converting factor small subunit
MKISVHIYGEMAKIYGKEQVIELEEEEIVCSLLNSIQKKREMAPGYLGEFRIDGADLAILVNGKNIAFLKGLNTTLANDDNVVIMPFMDGG